MYLGNIRHNVDVSNEYYMLAKKDEEVAKILKEECENRILNMTEAKASTLDNTYIKVESIAEDLEKSSIALFDENKVKKHKKYIDQYTKSLDA